MKSNRAKMSGAPKLMGGEPKAMEQKGATPVPDTMVLPTTGGPVLDRAGIKDVGYIDKKGTPYGEAAMFNMLPPGTDIESQMVADIRPMEMKQVTGLGYPGDGWDGE